MDEDEAGALDDKVRMHPQNPPPQPPPPGAGGAVKGCRPGQAQIGACMARWRAGGAPAPQSPALFVGCAPPCRTCRPCRRTSPTWSTACARPPPRRRRSSRRQVAELRRAPASQAADRTAGAQGAPRRWCNAHASHCGAVDLLGHARSCARRGAAEAGSQAAGPPRRDPAAKRLMPAPSSLCLQARGWRWCGTSGPCLARCAHTPSLMSGTAPSHLGCTLPALTCRPSTQTMFAPAARPGAEGAAAQQQAAAAAAAAAAAGQPQVGTSRRSGWGRAPPPPPANARGGTTGLAPCWLPLTLRHTPQVH